ncbi:MAG: hypothetical protein ACOC6G_00195 [Thermoproteota archaeon]
MSYMEDRVSDPFMEWFRTKDAEGFFADDFERVLAVLIDARFDQQTTAENALSNTRKVVKHEALKKTKLTEELPPLIPRAFKTAEEWTDLFRSSLPKLHSLARYIVEEQPWDAQRLLHCMLHRRKVPYLGVKTSRLAVRWLHELVDGVTIDMSTYKIPVDSLLYRVASRLGIVNPQTHPYFGEDSPGDQRIQKFAVEVFPDRPWLLDEVLWSTGRQPNKKGHCFPTNPHCPGCLFQTICPKNFLTTDPADIGTPNNQKSVGRRKTCRRKTKPQERRTEKQKRFAEYVKQLKEKGITGKEYREKIMKWSKDHN